MAEGGVAPPIKRPTRRPFSDAPQGAPFTDSDHTPTISSIPKIPARSAPPIPGGRAPPKPPDPGGRVPPKPPSKPPATAPHSSQPVPLRGDNTRTKAQHTKIPPRPASASVDKTAVKRRPEITIVCARPMSEVGFRDQTKNSDTSNKPSVSRADQSKPTTEVNLRNLPPVPPRTDKKEEDHGRDEKLIPRPSNKPPPIPQQLPSRVPPPGTAHHAPPPSPRPRVAARNSSSLSDKKPSSSQEEASSSSSERTGDMLLKKEPLAALKPVPVWSKNQPEVVHQSNSSGVTPSDDMTPSIQPQFKKPLRPTIIRPQKKSPVQKPKEESSLTEKITSKGDEHVDVKKDNTGANIENAEKSPMLRPKPVARERPKSMSIADSIKRFDFKTNSQANVPVTAGKKPPPPLTPKPKPNVLPKPTKSSNTSPSDSSPTSSSTSSTPVVVSPVGTSSSEQLVDSQQFPEKNVQKSAEEVFKPTTQPGRPTKRPTIIRAPPKPKRSSVHSSDDDADTDFVKEDDKVEESVPDVVVKRRVKATTDDILVNRSDKAPPLPKQRPVSIAGIPHGFSLPSNGQDETNNLDSNKEQFRPKPASRGSVALENSDHKSHGSHRPKIIGRPPPPVIIKQDTEEKKPSRPEAPDTSQRPKSAVCDGQSGKDDPSRPLPSQGGHPPPRPTSFDPKLTASQGISKPPVGRPPPPKPRERLTIPGESDDAVKDKEKKEGQPSPTLAPKRPPASPSKVNSRSNVKPEKPQPPRPASMSRTSLPHPLPTGKSSSPPKLPSRPTPGHPLYHYMAGLPHGIALHNFDGVDEEDLSFKATERVLLVSQMDESWLRGRIDDREGIFPAEFIQIVIPLPNQSPPVGPDITNRPIAAWGDDDDEIADTQSLKKTDLIGHGPRCCARFDFDGEGENDLQFEEGDYIRLLDKIGDEWAEGEINGCKGIFPLVYVEIIEDFPSKTSEAEHLYPQKSKVTENSPAVEAKLKPSSEDNVATVMYHFDGPDPGDLPLNVGDKVKVIGIVNEEWLYGQCGEQRGQFPSNFIDSIPNNLPPYDPEVKPAKQNTVFESSVEQKNDLPLSAEIYCVALHAFNGEGDDELSFSEGDRILVLENLGSDWCKGKLNNKCGIFPSNFVEMEKETPGNPLPEKPSDVKVPVQYGVALYEFDAMESNELSLKVGDRVLLGDFAVDASDWRWGELGGHRGIFPAAFVELES